MADKLFKLYTAMYANSPKPEEFHRFQAGYTAAATSMRERAMKCSDPANLPVDLAKDPPEDILDYVTNKIGQLPDIPE